MARTLARLTTALWAALALATATTAMAAAGGKLACPHVAAPPVLDGALDDWPALPMVYFDQASDWRPASQQFATWGGADDISAGVWVSWDAQAFHLAVRVRDDHLIRVRSVAEIDHGDSLVLSFVTADGKTVNEFVVAPLQKGYPVYRARPSAQAGEARTVTVGIASSQVESGGSRRIYEVTIPWSELTPLKAALGEQFALTVSVCDDDGEGMEGCMERRLPLVLRKSGFTVRPPKETAASPPSLAPVFPAPEFARFDEHSFVLKGRRAILYGGKVAYDSLSPSRWQAVLAELKAAGMNLVGITVPWRRHQARPDAVDLSTLKAFLSLCDQEGLWVEAEIGPYAGENYPGGGVPAWARALPSQAAKTAAVEAWIKEVAGALHAHDIAQGGSLAAVMVRPLPGGSAKETSARLTRLAEILRAEGVSAPILTANLPAARNGDARSMADILDTLSFYTAPGNAKLVAEVGALSRDENGPAVVSGLPGHYGDASGAMWSAGWVKAALAAGAKMVLVDDFAAGANPESGLVRGIRAEDNVIRASGARTIGLDELRLVGAMLQNMGPALAGAMEAKGAVTCDTPGVHAMARLGKSGGALFLVDTNGKDAHQVRCAFTNPQTGEQMAIPEAGAITLPAGAVKAFPLNLPLGRGVLRYSTSEVLGAAKVGERTVLVVYGEPDTAGEISLSWPGPPLVVGDLIRQDWNSAKKVLTLDYFHSDQDKCVLVDNLEILILSRARARNAAIVGDKKAAVVVSAGAHFAGGSRWPDKVQMALSCGPGEAQVTALTPHKPSAVLVDGNPVECKFATPERMAAFSLSTKTFEQESGPHSVWQRLGRAIIGGPPLLRAEFDRSWFMGEPILGDAAWQPVKATARGPDDLGASPGGFLALRARFDPAGRTRISVDPRGARVLVFLNGKFIPDLSWQEGPAEALLGDELALGENEVLLLMQVPAPAPGKKGAVQRPAGFPTVAAVGVDGASPIGGWEYRLGLLGEARGWTAQKLNVTSWHFIRFGPWQRQGRDLQKVSGIGWYRIPFRIPKPRQWTIPYRAVVTVTGAATVYLNGHLLGFCPDDGAYSFDIPGDWLTTDGDNALAIAVYGASNDLGLRRVEVAADREHMTKRRAIEISF